MMRQKLKQIWFLLILTLDLLGAHAQQKASIDYFRLQDVSLLDGPFKHAEQLDKQYLLALDPDRLLAPFLREAGLPAKAESYTNWENTGLDGHMGGHYLSALAMMSAATGDELIRQRLDYMLEEMKRCQEANGDGYIGAVPGGQIMWKEVAAGKIRAGNFDLNGKWVPLYNIHKTYAGLRDAYLYTQHETAKEMLLKFADWAINLTATLTDEQVQAMLKSEQGGLNETFADVYAITGNKKYLKLAHRFSDESILDPLLQQHDALTGLHANTQIPKVIGYKRVADLEGNEAWSEAARFFWETVVYKRSLAIGGNSVSEHFYPIGQAEKVISHIEGPETCNTYNMLKLTRQLYATSGAISYIDYYERALYNHILSTQNPSTGGFVYFTPMRPGHYRVYSQPQTSFWCCVGSGIENHAKYSEMIYAHKGDDLYVNLFIPSQLHWKESGLRLTQHTAFPDEAKTVLTVDALKKKEFAIYIRIPAWLEKGTFKLTINGENYPVQEEPGSYVALKRSWKKGDRIAIEMPMQAKVEKLDNMPYYAFLYGPLVLAAKTSTEEMTGMFADDSRGGHIAHGRQIPLTEIPQINSDVNAMPSLLKVVPGKPLSFRLSGLAGKTSEMDLIPFFRLHESRYILYWPQMLGDSTDAAHVKMQIKEKREQLWEKLTIDRVICGEQQPESDHGVKFEASETGFDKDVHWRRARGWFSYELRNQGQDAKWLQVICLSTDQTDAMHLSINGKLLELHAVKDSDKESTVAQYYKLPEEVYQQKQLILKVEAPAQGITPKVAEIRLLNKFDVNLL